MIDVKVIFIFVLLIFLAVCNSSLSRAFGEFPNVVSRDHAYADRRKGVSTLKCFIFSETVAYSFPSQRF